MQPIKTALCSFGMSGRLFHAPFLYHHPGFILAAVTERSRQMAGKTYPGIRSYTSVKEMLGDDQIELVIVNTPNTTHFNYAKAALKKGKHVIAEKPFTTNSTEGLELVALSKELGLQLGVYQNRRWDSDFQTVQQVLASGKLGTIVDAELRFDRYKPGLSAKVHKETPGAGSGLVYDLGSHLVDQALVLFGLPFAVFATTAINRPGSRIDDHFDIILFYPGLQVRLKASYLTRGTVPGYQVHGTAGSFLKNRSDVQEEDLQAGRNVADTFWGREPLAEQGLLYTEENGQALAKQVPTIPGNYMKYFDHLLAAIRSGKPLPVTAEDGLHVIMIIEAAYESVRTNKVVPLQIAV